MHDSLQEMGWEIVREHHSDKPGKWSRLWLYKDVYHVLSTNIVRYLSGNIIPYIIVLLKVKTIVQDNFSLF